MPTRWITFDCFGTLVDWQGGFSKILSPWAKGRLDQLLNAYHHYEPLIEAERPFRSYKEVLALTLTRAAKEIGIALTQKQAHCLSRQWATLPVFEDVEPALAALRSSGFKLGVLTNCDEDLFAKTQRNFRYPFDFVITAEKACDYKPGLSHFHRFERASGVPRAQWLHVACSWFHDIAPARKLGLKCIWLDRPGARYQAQTAGSSVLSARELPKAIARAFAKDLQKPI